MKKISKVFLFIMAFVLLLSGCGSSSRTDQATEDGKIKIRFGDILDITENKEEQTIIIKVKIESNVTKEMTVNQNYMNAWEFIKAYTGTEYKELTYWAVADMTDGTESKVVQFKVPEDAINGVLNGSILENQLGDHVTDLFLHPSLR